jgi:hypothetical protein
VTLEEFAKLSVSEKWRHIAGVMDYIQQMDNTYNMRRRYNPHHPPEVVKLEERALRTDQYQRWAHVKDLYASHRDELADTQDNELFRDCKAVLERIFTTEVDDALRGIISDDDG